MRSEWNEEVSERTQTEEYYGSQKEYGNSNFRKLEYGTSASEYFESANEWYFEKDFVDKKAKDGEESQKHQKLIRKMGYLVAASVAVVAIGQSALSALPKGTLIERNGIVWYGNGGVVSYITNNWHYMSYQGEEVVPEYKVGGYDDSNIVPNDNGYTEYGHCIFDDKGNVVWEGENDKLTGYITITDDDIVFVERDNNSGQQNFIYQKLDGTIIYESGWHDMLGEQNGMLGATPFCNGRALVYDGEKIISLDTKGNQTILADWGKGISARDVDNRGILLDSSGEYTIDNVPHRIVGACVDGYYIATNLREQCILVNIDTGEILPALGSADWIGAVNSSGFEGLVCKIGASTWLLRSYLEDGAAVAHYKTYVCRRSHIDGTGEHKEYLVDLRTVDENGYLTEYVAMYDAIYFDNSKYLMVREDDKYFYIDFEGNVVSDAYYRATTFNEDGYALIMEAPGCAYLIDENLNEIEKLEGITDIDVEARGEIFIVYKEATQYIYYYEK